ncbi:MAG: WYL domain-containing protein [Acidimicrobiia bacterium]|nr:WYL domain-containing protein [Acidimicrobiia bacterium]MXZ77578.1 WYL domain-containing protein [Acidimicrobiia bacterium]MYB09706.1 WYL domain-containing protein [Acidimicrobiia bacterium]MYB75473.1 WYL domain-containing protein [Acidimicrobiia bacterium]MYE74420.1 WYL domain-containing protein [Acidimicrobiia bacterium]
MSRLSAGDRLRRMLELVPWVMSQGGAELDEISQRFDYPEAELREDLVRVLFVVGLHPFTPDELINVMGLDEEDNGGWVAISNADYFSRPLRLTSGQALGLIGAGEALLSDADPDGPLSRGLAKLAAGLGVSVGEDLAVSLGESAGEWVEPLLGAVADRRQVRIRYFSFGRGQESDRIVHPYRVFSEMGNWYLQGNCLKAGGVRVFRIDRIRSLEALEEFFDPPDETRQPSAFEARSSDPRVVLRLAPGTSWAIEKYPTEEQAVLDSGEIDATMPVSQISRLERLLLQLGPQAELRSADPPVAADQARIAAQRVLARYR